MLRKKYQETYVIRKNKIQDISKEVQQVSYLFEELFEEVKKQDTDIKTISEEVEETKKIIIDGNETIEETNKIKSFYYILTGSIIGGGLGSIVLLYNPYVAIGSCICGLVGGGLMGKYYK